MGLEFIIIDLDIDKNMNIFLICKDEFCKDGKGIDKIWICNLFVDYKSFFLLEYEILIGKFYFNYIF